MFPAFELNDRNDLDYTSIESSVSFTDSVVAKAKCKYIRAIPVMSGGTEAARGGILQKHTMKRRPVLPSMQDHLSTQILQTLALVYFKLQVTRKKKVKNSAFALFCV